MTLVAATPDPSCEPALVRARLEEFLAHWCDRPLVPARFSAAAPGETGAQRLAALARSAGCTEVELVEELTATVRSRGADDAGPVTVGDIEVPVPLLVFLAECIAVGQGCETVTHVDRLEELLAIHVEERDALQGVLETYPVRLSAHVARQMRFSSAVARQYRPFPDELAGDGAEHTWVGQLQDGMVEQMYPNRVILLLSNACPVYCRFCFRKHRTQRNQAAPTTAALAEALAFVRQRVTVEEVLITGGDPFVRGAALRSSVAALAGVEHVRSVRLATRAVSYEPDLLLAHGWLDTLTDMQRQLEARGKRLELATHFVHPDELSVGALRIITTLCRRGVPVYVQTPLLAGCNDAGPELVELYTALRAAGAEAHYVFMPSHPVRGNETYATSIARGLQVARYLRAHLCERAMPRFATPTSIGKIDWATSGWAVEETATATWLRTPYSAEHFHSFAPTWRANERVRTNSEGGLDVALDGTLGDGSLAHALVPEPEPASPRTDSSALVELRDLSARDARLLDNHIGAPVAGIARSHLTCVEIDAGVTDGSLTRALAYVQRHGAITDVILSHAHGLLDERARILALVERVHEIAHVSAIRLRSQELIAAPERFTHEVIAELAAFNRLQVVRPCRLELETQILHASELRATHREVTLGFARTGVTVVSNTPLLGNINDNSGAVLAITRGARHAGMEIGSLWVAGMPIQGRWNLDRPIASDRLVNIASHLRRMESGRALPRFVVRTRLGAVDFSVAPPVLLGDGDVVRARMRPHDLAHFVAIDSGFEWPEDVTLDDDGHPLVPITGVSLPD